MPELPEVECLTRALQRTLCDRQVTNIDFYRTSLRTAIPVKQLRQILIGKTITKIWRRSKYLLMETPAGVVLFHFGMTGKFLLLSQYQPIVAHTHVVFSLSSADKAPSAARFLHFIDPRRFGFIGCSTHQELEGHCALRQLGVEPLTTRDLGHYLWLRSRKRRQPLKNFLMDAHIVVGIGNIYASETLFLVGVRPTTPASELDLASYRQVARISKKVLRESIKAGGTSFRDFLAPNGKPGTNQNNLQVYGRAGEACRKCHEKIESLRLGGRSSFYCPHCQK